MGEGRDNRDSDSWWVSLIDDDDSIGKWQVIEINPEQYEIQYRHNQGDTDTDPNYYYSLAVSNNNDHDYRTPQSQYLYVTKDENDKGLWRVDDENNVIEFINSKGGDDAFAGYKVAVSLSGWARDIRGDNGAWMMAHLVDGAEFNLQFQ